MASGRETTVAGAYRKVPEELLEGSSDALCNSTLKLSRYDLPAAEGMLGTLDPQHRVSGPVSKAKGP